MNHYIWRGGGVTNFECWLSKLHSGFCPQGDKYFSNLPRGQFISSFHSFASANIQSADMPPWQWFDGESSVHDKSKQEVSLREGPQGRRIDNNILHREPTGAPTDLPTNAPTPTNVPAAYAQFQKEFDHDLSHLDDDSLPTPSPTRQIVTTHPTQSAKKPSKEWDKMEKKDQAKQRYDDEFMNRFFTKEVMKKDEKIKPSLLASSLSWDADDDAKKEAKLVSSAERQSPTLRPSTFESGEFLTKTENNDLKNTKSFREIEFLSHLKLKSHLLIKRKMKVKRQQQHLQTVPTTPCEQLRSEVAQTCKNLKGTGSACVNSCTRRMQQRVTRGRDVAQKCPIKWRSVH